MLNSWSCTSTGRLMLPDNHYISWGQWFSTGWGTLTPGDIWQQPETLGRCHKWGWRKTEATIIQWVEAWDDKTGCNPRRSVSYSRELRSLKRPQGSRWEIPPRTMQLPAVRQTLPMFFLLWTSQHPVSNPYPELMISLSSFLGEIKKLNWDP